MITEHDAYYLARLYLHSEEIDPSTLDAPLAQQAATAMISANGEGPDAALNTWLSQQEPGPAQAIRDAMMRVDPDAAAPASAANTAPLASEVPPLPVGAQLDASLGHEAGGWLDTFVEYASVISPMTPHLFHESAGLWLPSTVIARRLVVQMPYEPTYPNLAVIWLAPTTLWAKSTGQRIARDLARRVCPHLLASQEMTVEAFLSDLAGVEPTHLDKLPDDARRDWEAERKFAAQRGLLLDEMSGLLASAGRDYNGGLIEVLLRLYDCDPYLSRSTRGQGRVVVRQAYLTIMGASTPTAMAPHLGADRLWEMGWWPRFAVLTPEQDRPEWRTSRSMAEPPALAEHLQALDERLPKGTWPDPPTALSIGLGKGVYSAWEAYDKACRYDLLRNSSLDERLFGTYGRLPTQAMKVASILAALDWATTTGSAPTITTAHLSRAQAIVERWRASAHRALLVRTEASYGAKALRVLNLIDRTPLPGPTFRDLCRGLRDLTPDDIRSVLRQLEAAGEVESTEPISRGGRPAIHFHRPASSS